VRDIPRSTFAHQDEERFIPLSAGNGELILLTYLRGPKGLNQRNATTNNILASNKQSSITTCSKLSGSNVSLNTLFVISETIFTANHLTCAKHSAFSTNHVAYDTTEHNLATVFLCSFVQ